jgi:hypothetical protein
MLHFIKAYNLVSLPRSVNAPTAISVIWFADRCLHEQYVQNHVIMRQCFVANNRVRLPSPVNVSLAIDVILVEDTDLSEQHVKSLCDAAELCYIQFSQASESSECTTSNRSDLVDI